MGDDVEHRAQLESPARRCGALERGELTELGPHRNLTRTDMDGIARCRGVLAERAAEPPGDEPEVGIGHREGEQARLGAHGVK